MWGIYSPRAADIEFRGVESCEEAVLTIGPFRLGGCHISHALPLIHPTGPQLNWHTSSHPTLRLIVSIFTPHISLLSPHNLPRSGCSPCSLLRRRVHLLGRDNNLILLPAVLSPVLRAKGKNQQERRDERERNAA
jgi:hypothetical protein